jgi:hypothetical protein
MLGGSGKAQNCKPAAKATLPLAPGVRSWGRLGPIRALPGQGAAVRFPRRGRPARPAERLMQGAGVDPKATGNISDLAMCRDVAYRITQRTYRNAGTVMGVAEELLADEDNYDLVISFLEDVQNLLSHDLAALCAPGDITPWLGQRCAVCWTTLATFWDSVAAWCSETRVALRPNDELLSLQNEKLRALLWTGNRTLPTGAVVGLAEAVLYEKAGGAPIPGYSHIAAAIKSIGPS